MTTYRRNNANRDAGFTLIEILVVIVIIGLLAGMTTTVLVSARQSVRGSVVAAQMAQLSMALDDYKNRYGEYPPDFSDEEAVRRHLKKRWPRYQLRPEYSDIYVQFIDDVAEGCRIASSENPVDYLGQGGSPADSSLTGQHVWRVAGAPYLSSLIFWLGGLPDVDGKPSGFYANPKAPFGVGISRISRAIREAPLYAFDLKNVGATVPDDWDNPTCWFLAEDDEVWDGSAFVYVPAFVQGDLPIVYFRPSANVPYSAKSVNFAEDSSLSFVTQAVPYARTYDESSDVYEWFEAKRFQLVHPGVDGAFGPNADRGGVPTLADRKTLYAEDADNVVSFATAGVLESEYAD